MTKLKHVNLSAITSNTLTEMRKHVHDHTLYVWMEFQKHLATDEHVDIKMDHHLGCTIILENADEEFRAKTLDSIVTNYLKGRPKRCDLKTIAKAFRKESMRLTKASRNRRKKNE